MLATVIQSAISKLGGSFSKAFLGQPCRKECGDNSLLETAGGQIYRLESILGVGGLAVVYRAVRLSDKKEVALKVANISRTPEAKPLLFREADLMSRLEHPNIVKLIDSGSTVDGDPFIAMEILEGQTLEQLLISNTALELDRVALICLQVAEAVQHAHEKGILHRDIKPSNIMIVNDNGVEKAVVYDFGISLPVGADGSSFDDSSSGSLLYASPEQLGDQVCSYNTDVYQLALVTFEALTGRLPFEISLAGAMDYRRGIGPVLLSDEDLGEKKINSRLRKVLEGALDRNPRQRTRNMSSFISELSMALLEPGVWLNQSSLA
ncbi:MAG: serine/threonine protein kinase [Candidatus Obscuribacterales bacterium]|nr:serine/threonine protein kinase [Candidatus Obscuribacterales bacterium]